MLLRRQELADRGGLNLLRQATENGVWLTAIPLRLNGTELPWEEFQDNVPLRYGIVPLNLPIYCDVCGKKFLVPHSLSCPKGGLVLERHNDATKEWSTLFSQAINPSDISYGPKINSKTVQGERNGAKLRFATGEQERGGAGQKGGRDGTGNGA